MKKQGPIYFKVKIIKAGTIQSLKIDIRGNNVKCESAYAGGGIIRAHQTLQLKNLNGNFDVEAGKSVLIDGCDGSIELKAGEEVDIHLDSSVKKATITGKFEPKFHSKNHNLDFEPELYLSCIKR